MDAGQHSNFLIGIDDTDNAESRGTGYNARQLAHALESKGLGKVNGITRHQLFVDPAIRYTSQNSSACINISTTDPEGVKEVCRDYLLHNSAPGSDAGLCIIPAGDVPDTIKNWGEQAKQSVLKLKDAIEMAVQSGIYLEGFTGNHEGMIGALAAVGLHAGGNDGRFIWRRGIKELREMEAGIFTSEKLKNELKLDEIISLEGEHPADTDRIEVNEWIRPILKNHKAVLITQRTENNNEHDWKITGKEIIRSIS